MGFSCKEMDMFEVAARFLGTAAEVVAEAADPWALSGDTYVGEKRVCFERIAGTLSNKRRRFVRVFFDPRLTCAEFYAVGSPHLIAQVAVWGECGSPCRAIVV